MSTFSNAALLSCLPMPILVLGPDQRVQMANAATYELFGHDCEGRSYVTLLRQPRLIEAIEQSYDRQQLSQAQYVISSGVIDVEYQVNIAPQDGHLVLCFQDQSKANELDVLRRDFVANVSHELRTPLASVSGFIETLRGAAKEDPQAQERFLGIMHDEVSRMTRLVRDLLSLSHVDKTALQHPETRCDLAALTHACIQAMAPVIQSAKGKVQITDHSNGAQLRADPEQMRQVLTNLVENALRYSENTQPIQIEISSPQYESRLGQMGLRLSVHDHGVGIAPHHIPRLSERFYRVDSHRARHTGGTGLGLAIVKHIVQRHHGRLEINSTLGKGSIFSVVLPFSEENDELS